MGGTWMSVVMGFGGMRTLDNKLVLNPFLPNNWKSYQFRIDFRRAHLSLKKERKKLTIVNYSDVEIPAVVWGKDVILKGNSKIEFNRTTI
jgi:maltose phosphorylase